MALTRKLLKGMGLTDEQMDTIIEAHTDTVDGLKADVAKYKADAEQLPKVKRELDTLKAAGDGGYQEKYEKVKKDFDDYKAEVSGKEAKAAKEKAARAYYESKGITGKSLDIAIRGSGTEIESLEMDGDKIKDTSALDELVNGTFSGLVATTKTRGANTSNPPANGGVKMTKDEIFKIKDPVQRQNAIAENIGLFNNQGKE